MTLVSGSAGSGKTQFLVERAAERYASDPFAPTLVLVPTVRHADQFRRRLVDRCGVAVNLDVGTIGVFARRQERDDAVLAPDVAAELLQRATRQRIEGGGAAYFAPIADMPGLATLVGEAVSALVQDGVDPEALMRAASGSGDRSLAAVADIYTSYLDALSRREWLDPRMLPAVAARQIREGAAVPGQVLVDGFLFFRSAELELLAALAERTDVLVAFDPDAGDRARHTAAEIDRLFPEAERVATAHEPQAAEVGATTLRDAEAQLRAMVREIKERLTADRALRPSDFAVTFRQVMPGLALARHVFAEYELPFDPAAGERLARTPIGSWLLRLLRLPEHGWRMLDLIDLLSSGFIDRGRWQLDRGGIELVTRHARRNHLWSGMEELRRVAPGLEDDARVEGRAPDFAERLRAAAVAFTSALDELEALLDRPQPETAAAFARELDEALFGPSAIVRLDSERPASVDVEITALRRELSVFVAIDDALGGEPVDFAIFVARLEARMEAPAVVVREAGGVLFAPMHTLHGLRFAHVSVGGLVEGEFPAPRTARPLIDARGRALLAEAGLDLPPEARAAEDELWRTVASRAEHSMSLWRPRLDDRGRPRAASYYFDVLDATPTDQPQEIAPEGAASQRELAAALTGRWRAGEQRRPQEMAAWPVVRASVAVEQVRRSFDGAGEFEGVLPAASLERLTRPEAVWSASRFESYLTCSFQFFGGYGLRLNELDQEPDAADAATRGTVIHEMLEEALAPLAASERPLDRGSLDEALTRLRAEGPAIWERAPDEHGFGRSALWRIDGESVLVALEALLEREADRSSQLGITAIVGTEVDVSGEIGPADDPIRVIGKVDRLDRSDDRLQVVDYKSGRGIPRRDLVERRRVQLQLYTHLARQQFQEQRTVARYAYIDPRSERWQLDTGDADDATLIDEAIETVVAVRNAVRVGDLRVNPAVAACPSYCSFLNICRVNEFSRWKQWS